MIEYKALVTTVKDHAESKPSPIVQRYKFNTHIQRKDESNANFIAALRHLAKYCDYGTSLDDVLQDRLVCGVIDDTIQHRLLT